MRKVLRRSLLSLVSLCALSAQGQTDEQAIAALLKAGRLDAAAARVAGADPAQAPALRLLRLDIALSRQDYATAEPLLMALQTQAVTTAAERGLLYRWLFARDDAAAVDQRTRGVLEAEGAESVDLLAAGRLALELMQYERAEACLRRALQRAGTDADRAAALKGLGQLAFRRLDFDSSLTLLNDSLALDETADGLTALAATLIRLARTDEAITALERAVQRNPYHEEAHYYLGNGYARKNYTELAAHYGPRIDDAARQVRSASDAFDRGDYTAARDLGFAALRDCPEYGRAHNLLAKALQFQRFGIDVHRADYERRFAALAMPVVPDIERYVLNWASLSPRQQKRVALSVAPWKAFIPLLVAGGSTHFIKPLYMKLSETPGLENLKNQRINTDARLWDDVRGAGGFATVTGIEDVEKSIFDSYNTVLHELTHQVHGVLTAEQMREIQAHYGRAKARHESSRDAFLSRYAGGTVWEYFAEGVNALESPRRDAYDGREIVAERLARMDPDLQALVKRVLAQTDVAASLPIAYTNAGHDQLSKGHLAAALAHFERAAAVAPRDESVLVARLYGLAVQGERARTAAAARQLLQAFPASGGAQTEAAEALWHSGQRLQGLTAALAAARRQVRSDDRYRVDLALGGYYQRLGDVGRAVGAYDAVLAYQADNPEALWGKGAALALAQRWDEAFALYERAMRARTGVVELRLDLARDLLRAGRLAAARLQLDAARLLDPGHPVTGALDGWLALLEGDAQGALQRSTAALASAGWCDLARLVQARALRALGRGGEAEQAVQPLRQRIARNSPPSYVYRAESGGWLSVHELPAWERRLLAELRPTR